jgi:hypothetical protein
MRPATKFYDFRAAEDSEYALLFEVREGDFDQASADLQLGSRSR